jgi:hypothetical protein
VFLDMIVDANEGIVRRHIVSIVCHFEAKPRNLSPEKISHGV